ncbi:MAG: hypothetical protein V4787_27075 [Pseudomonadota bacterium]
MRKKKILQLALLCAGLFACAVPAAAQGVYRCGNSYSQQPCPGGKEVAVEDTRNAAQREQTDKAVQRDAKAAEVMEKARLKEEAKPAQALLPPAKVDEEEIKVKSVSAKAKKLEHFSAVSPRKPGDPPPKKKASPKKKAD